MPILFYPESFIIILLHFLLFHASFLAGHKNTKEFPPNYEHSVKHSYEVYGDQEDALPLPDVLDKERIAQERPHIQEHLDIPIDTKDMTEKELQFHYFKIADADRNNKLDGQELVYFIIHKQHENIEHNDTTRAKGDESGEDGHHEEHKDDEGNKQMRIFTDKELIDAIDPIMERTDHNRDGMIDWQEFIQSIEEQEQAGK